ncbi:non-ribosomal peptide synthetase [Streptomyces sp. NBC_00435]|uniref:non-ribosomal peptide synthetase n=1 Tax=Streptomyces sp. NBC_00435 TaxID=2903649 RepID=UPI002E21C0B0
MHHGSARPDGQSFCVEARVHELFTRHAFLTPDRVALTTPGGDLTYGALNARADRLADLLIAAGAGHNAAVGVLLERSAEFVIAVLAVLKAGCCYVPLDPEYPAARLSLMVEAAGVELLVSRGALPDRIPGCAAPVLDIDAATAPDGASGVMPGPVLRVHPDDLAYVMFTSGSTGTPKAVAIPHSGLVRLVDRPGYVDLDEDEVLAAVSSPSFDASTFEIWGALANGARLVVGPPGPLSASEVGALLREEGVTCAWLTAGLFNVMVDECLDDLAGLRQLLSGGDIMSPVQARRFLEAAPRCRLINGYGPTEATTFTTCHTVTLTDTRGPRIPVGKPIDGTWTVILDEDLEPVPAGTPGTLYAAGLGLARGYLGDPELTAQRFVPDPTGCGGRIYNTGDLALRRPDGTIEFLGRADQQIKKRGFRVEPLEIEEALREDPLLRDAAVVLEGARSDDSALVAHLVLDSGAGAPAAEVREVINAVRARLRERLPAYMVPDRFAVTDALPLNPNGKVDRRALSAAASAAPGAADVVDAADAADALTGTESALIAIWTEILEAHGIGRDSDFFELGGQSFQASRMTARMRTRLGVDVPLAAVFEYPTPALLAEVIDRAT